jgi:hypothetical protein
VNELRESPPLVVGSRLASRVSNDVERGPLPYLVFSGVLDRDASERLREEVEYALGDGYDGYVARRRALGVIAEVIYLIHAPQGDVALLVLHAPGAIGLYEALGGALHPFHTWFERRALELFGLPRGEPGPAGDGERTEVVFRWRM